MSGAGVPSWDSCFPWDGPRQPRSPQPCLRSPCWMCHPPAWAHRAPGATGAFPVTQRVFLPSPIPAGPPPHPRESLAPAAGPCPGLSLPRATGCFGNITSLRLAPAHPWTNPRGRVPGGSWFLHPAGVPSRDGPRGCQPRSAPMIVPSSLPACRSPAAMLPAPIPRQDTCPGSQTSPWGHP